MNKAQQKIILNSINVEIMRIRAQELNMQTNFLTNFGTQSAAMVGFVAAALSEIEAFKNFSHSPRCFILLYWYASALTMASGIFSLSTSVMIDVYGTNLALRGPEGSLVKAVEDISHEQKIMFRSFLLTTFFFAMHFIGMCFALFKTNIGYIAMGVIFVGMYVWRKHSLKIYHRFCWTDQKIAKLLRTESIADPVNHFDKRFPHMASNFSKGDNFDESSMNRERLLACRAYKKKQLEAKKIVVTEKMLQEEIPSDIEEEKLYKLPYEPYRSQSVSRNSFDALGSKKIFSSHFMGGIQIQDTTSLGGKTWKNIFGVIDGSSLVLYPSERKYLSSESPEPLFKRPIDLTSLTLVVPPSDTSYPIHFEPIEKDDNRKAWELRCETQESQDAWIHALTTSLIYYHGLVPQPRSK